MYVNINWKPLLPSTQHHMIIVIIRLKLEMGIGRASNNVKAQHACGHSFHTWSFWCVSVTRVALPLFLLCRSLKLLLPPTLDCMSFSHKLIVLRQSRSERLKRRLLVRPSVGRSLFERTFFSGKKFAADACFRMLNVFLLLANVGGPIERFNLMGRRHTSAS